MKRLLSLALVVVSVFLLASCGENRKKLDVSHQEAQALLKEVDQSKILDEVISFKGTVYLKFKTETKDANGAVVNKNEVVVDGSLEVYVNAKTYEDFYVYAKLDLTLTTNTTDSEVSKGKGMGIKGTVYVIKDTVYLDGSVVTDGVEVKAKNKLSGVFTEEQFNEILSSFQGNEGVQDNLFELNESSVFELYKVGSSYEIQSKLTEDDIKGLLALFTIGMKLEFKGETKAEFVMRFSDIIESLKLNFNVEIDMTSINTTDPLQSSGSIILRANIDFNMKSKMPSKLPTADSLASYVEGGVLENFMPK